MGKSTHAPDDQLAARFSLASRQLLPCMLISPPDRSFVVVVREVTDFMPAEPPDDHPYSGSSCPAIEINGHSMTGVPADPIVRSMKAGLFTGFSQRRTDRTVFQLVPACDWNLGLWESQLGYPMRQPEAAHGHERRDEVIMAKSTLTADERRSLVAKVDARRRDHGERLGDACAHVGVNPGTYASWKRRLALEAIAETGRRPADGAKPASPAGRGSGSGRCGKPDLSRLDFRKAAPAPGPAARAGPGHGRTRPAAAGAGGGPDGRADAGGGARGGAGPAGGRGGDMISDRSECLIRAMRREPFRPFTLHLADGRKLRVPSPDWIAHRPGGRIAFVFDEDGVTGNVVDLAEVVGLL